MLSQHSFKMYLVTISIAALSTVFLVYSIIYKVIENYIWDRFSILKDVHLLSKRRPNDKKLSGTAIICGGSISGLLAARVCANHFDKVVIVEPEQWVAVGELGMEDHHRDPQAPKRSRVAQYTAYHSWTGIITCVMEEMFSSFEQAIKDAGGRLTFGQDIFHIFGYPKLLPANFPYYYNKLYPKILNMSRGAFETTLRRLVIKTCTQVEYLHGTVTGLVYDETLNRVSGVSVKYPNDESAELEGSLVVDATGPFMGGYHWLKAIPKFSSSLDNLRLSFDPKIRYAKIEFALPPKLEEEFRKYGFPADEDKHRKLYAFLPVNGTSDGLFFLEKREKNYLQIGCGGYNWRGHINSVGEVEDYARALNLKRPLPEWINDVLHTLQNEHVPVTFQHFKYPLSVYVKYHEAKSLPSNFVVIGDAIMQTDPLLAQGGSKACAIAVILNAQLHKSSPDAVGFLPRSFAKKYFDDVKDRVEFTWTNMRNNDYNFPTTIPIPGDDLEKTDRFVRAYVSKFLELTTKDAEISAAFARHVAWLDPPSYILAPWIARRVAWAWFKQLFGYETLC